MLAVDAMVGVDEKDGAWDDFFPRNTHLVNVLRF